MSRSRPRQRSGRALAVPPGGTIGNSHKKTLKTVQVKLHLPHGGRILNARYDSAQKTPENSKHWSMVDSLSADEANSLDVRKTLRERARYEVANNSYAKGIVLTLANDCVGTGPRLQLLWDDAVLCRTIEDAFFKWSNAVDLPGKLRSMRMAKAVDGRDVRCACEQSCD